MQEFSIYPVFGVAVADSAGQIEGNPIYQLYKVGVWSVAVVLIVATYYVLFAATNFLLVATYVPFIATYVPVVATYVLFIAKYD